MSTEIKINESHHPGGIPAVGSGVEIFIGSVSIGLNKEDFQKLTEVIDEVVGKNLKQLTELYDSYWERTKKNYEFIKEFRNIFYDGEDDFYVKRSVVDETKLGDALNRYANFLGFE